MNFHPEGGFECGAVGPESSLVCTKKDGHGNKNHHVRGTSVKWHGGKYNSKAYWPVPHPYNDNEMSEGEWQAYGRYGY